MRERAPALNEPETVASAATDLAPRPPRRAGVERFDDAILVTRTRAWVGLAAALAMVVGVVVWATTTTVNQTITRRGAALANGTLTEVASPATGIVGHLDVHVDETVHAGQELGAITTGDGKSHPVVADFDGKVLQILHGIGSPVVAGATLLSLAQTSGKVVVRVFVTSTQSQELKVGNHAVLDFPGDKVVSGEVAAIGDVPLTTDQVALSLGSSSLAGLLAQGNGSVSVTVVPSQRWSRRFDGFDVASVTMIVGTKRPIDYVF